jgi:hypothetical protein
MHTRISYGDGSIGIIGTPRHGCHRVSLNNQLAINKLIDSATKISHGDRSIGIIGIMGMGIGLNNKLGIKKLIDGACNILMYSRM